MVSEILIEDQVSEPALPPGAADRLAAKMFAWQATVAIANLPVTFILARSLAPSGYGSFQLLNRLAFLVVSVACLGLPHALCWAMTSARSDRDRHDTYWLATWTSLVSGGVVAVVALGFAVAGVHPGPAAAWCVLAVYPAFNVFAAAIANAARGLLDIRAVATIRISQAVSWLAVTLLLLGIGHITLFSAIATMVGCQALSAAIALRVVIRSGALKHRGMQQHRSQPKTWRFARQVFVGVTIRDWNVYLDQVILGFVLPHRELGIYAIAAGLTLALSLLSAPITTTTQPIMQTTPESERLGTICGLVAAVGLLVGAFALLLALGAPLFIPWILGPSYHGAIVLIQILAVGVLLDATNSCLHGVLLGLNSPASSSRSATLGLVVNVLGWIALLPSYGVVGAAITSDLAYGAVTLSMAVAVRRRLPGTTWPMIFVGVARETTNVPRRLRQLLPGAAR